MEANQETPGQRDPGSSREDRRASGEESEGWCGQVLQSRRDVREEEVPEVREQRTSLEEVRPRQWEMQECSCSEQHC